VEQPPPANAELTYREVAARDPLSPVTRKERLYLLAVSMIGIAVVNTGLVPTKVATFGIELDKPNRSALLTLLALVTAYFFVAFVIYAASDYIARQAALAAAQRREESTLRFQEAALRLKTSEENVRRLYAAGQLWEYAEQKGYTEPDQNAVPPMPPQKKHIGTLKDILEAPFDLRLVLHAYQKGLGYDPPEGNRGRFFPGPRERVAMFYRYYFEGFMTHKGANWTIRSRVFFEFLLPLLVGAYAIFALLSRALLFS